MSAEENNRPHPLHFGNMAWKPEVPVIASKEVKVPGEPQQPAAPVSYGFCIYTDGSAIPNPGNAGWAFHGYAYLDEAPKKGSGNPDHILTQYGYVLKVDALRDGTSTLVTPVHYVDGFGSYDTAGQSLLKISNNVAELNAAYYGLLHAKEYPAKVIRFYTDSEYVRNGMDKWVPVWKKHHWHRSDGTDIKNVSEWKKLSDLTDELRGKGVTVEFNWVKAHNDILGNVRADRLAMLGTVHSMAAVVKNEIITSAPDGYWGYNAGKHPFFSHPCLYFNTRRDNLIPGEYYLGYHGDNDDDFGNRSSTTAFAVIRMLSPDPIVEMLLEHQSEMAANTDNLMKMLLGNVFRAEIHKELTLHGVHGAYRKDPYLFNLFGMDDEPITTQFKPAKRAYYAVESIGFLTKKLDEFLAQKDSDAKSLVVTDITPLLYETHVKTSKKETKEVILLKDHLQVGFAVLDVAANYMVDAAAGELGQEPVKLTLGIDMLDRNGLKRLESSNPKVSLITWMESPEAFRYATVVETDDGIGVWCGLFANIRFLSQNKKKELKAV